MEFLIFVALMFAADKQSPRGDATGQSPPKRRPPWGGVGPEPEASKTRRLAEEKSERIGFALRVWDRLPWWKRMLTRPKL